MRERDFKTFRIFLSVYLTLSICGSAIIKLAGESIQILMGFGLFRQTSFRQRKLWLRLLKTGTCDHIVDFYIFEVS